MIRLSKFVLAHRWQIVVFWVVTFVAGGVLASTTVDRLKFQFDLPGQPGYIAEQQLLAEYGNGGSMPPSIPVITVPDGTTVVQQRDKVASVFAALRTTYPMTRIVDYGTTGNAAFLTNDGRTTFGLIFTPPQAGFAPGVEAKFPEELAKQAQLTGFSIELTGYNQLASGGETEGPSVLVETLLAATGALVVLAFVFASFLAIVPLLVAAVSILSTFLVLLGLTYLTDVSFVVQFLISLIGLGVAVDYSLLIVNRWREERDRGRANNDAVTESVRTAGHAVLASAFTVAISLVALVVIPVPFLRSMGLGGMLIPLVSAGVVLTLLPVLLSAIGPRVDWPKVRHERHASRPWSAWTRGVVKFRLPAALVAIGILVLLISPLAEVKVGQARSDSLASSGPAYEGLTILRGGGVASGVITPLEILVKRDDQPAALAAAEQVASAARNVDGVAFAVAPDNRKDGYAVVEVVPLVETVDIGDAKVVDRLRDAVKDVPGFVGIAGTGAVVLDYRDAVYKPFPWVLALIALVTFILLVRAFRSILLPLKAVLLNVMSVAATFGAVVFFWQQGHGSEALFGVEPTGAITFWLPVVIFAFLFGLSMDYEVFILSRVREEYDRTGSTRAAVIIGMGRTGRLVTSAALILFLSFVALAGTPQTDIKVLGTALGFGILLDATVVRALLVPALVSLFGKYNWWLPGWVAKVLFIKPSPLKDEVDAPDVQGDLEDAELVGK